MVPSGLAMKESGEHIEFGVLFESGGLNIGVAEGSATPSEVDGIKDASSLEHEGSMGDSSLSSVDGKVDGGPTSDGGPYAEVLGLSNRTEYILLRLFFRLRYQKLKQKGRAC